MEKMEKTFSRIGLVRPLRSTSGKGWRRVVEGHTRNNLLHLLVFSRRDAEKITLGLSPIRPHTGGIHRSRRASPGRIEPALDPEEPSRSRDGSSPGSRAIASPTPRALAPVGFSPRPPRGIRRVEDRDP